MVVNVSEWLNVDFLVDFCSSEAQSSRLVVCHSMRCSVGLACEYTGAPRLPGMVEEGDGEGDTVAFS